MASFSRKTSFASAAFSASVLNQFFQSRAQFFYITEMKLSPSSYALALTIWAIWNAINDPLAGWLMDRRTTRYGRRLPWMIGFWIPLVVSFGLVWTPPIQWVGKNGLLFIWVLVVLIIYDTSYTIVILAWSALLPELFPSVQDRNMIVGIKQVFSFFSLIAALILPPFFISDGDIPSYATFGWVIAGAAFVNLGLSFWGSQEPKRESISEEEKYEFREGFELLFKNKAFQVFLIGNMINYFAYGQFLAMLPFYRKYVLQQPIEFETNAYGGGLVVTLISLIFWVWLITKTNSRYVYITSALLFAGLVIPIWFVRIPTIALYLLFFVGFAVAGQQFVADLLIAEVVDEDFIKYGLRREGVFYGFNGFFIRLPILFQAVSLAVISELTNFDKYAENQSFLAQQGIMIQFIVLPLLAYLIGAYLYHRYYPLYGDRLKEQQARLLELTREIV